MDFETPKPLTGEDRSLLKAYINHEAIRTMLQAFRHLREMARTQLLGVKTEELPGLQGYLRGVEACINLISIEASRAPKEPSIEEAQAKKPAKPLVPASARVTKPKT